MPRLGTWCALGGGLSAAVYGVYEFVYIPSVTTKREMELFVEAEKSVFISIVQRMGVLKSFTPRINADRIYAFCELHLLRRDVYALPLRLQSAYDKALMMRQLDTLESETCSWLRFRDTPLTAEEQWRCFAAFCVYWLVFRLCVPLAMNCPGVPVHELRWRMHQCSKVLLVDVLDARSNLVIDPACAAKLDQLKREVRERGNDDVSAECAVLRDCPFVWSPKCWVEELAFWGCAGNPWLPVAAAEERCGTETGQTAALSSPLLTGPSIMHSAEVPFAEPAECSVQPQRTALAITAADATRERASPLEAERPVCTKYGYPCAARDGVSNASSSMVIPVAITGSEKLLYASDAVAITDRRPSYSSDDRFLDLMQLQYGRGTGGQLPAQSVEVARAVTDDRLPKSIRDSRLFLPLFSQESMWNFFGGRSRTGVMRTVHVYVGAPCLEHELSRAWLMTHREQARALARASDDKADEDTSTFPLCFSVLP